MEGGSRCGGPSVGFLVATLAATAAATGLLCAAVVTRHWEAVSWEPRAVRDIRNRSLRQMEVDWFLNGRVPKITVKDPKRNPEQWPTVFLVPMHGGIWTLCVDLTEQELQLMRNEGFPETSCINYLTPNPPLRTSEEARPDWQHRMQNLSISCALVCLIILGSSALVGAFGVLKHQISAVLVTGVMYLLAATFALFTLTIIHFKRARSAECRGGGGRLGDGLIPQEGTVIRAEVWEEYLPARVVSVGWSLELGWGAAAACALASALWILLAKVMRYNPLSHIFT